MTSDRTLGTRILAGIRAAPRLASVAITERVESSIRLGGVGSGDSASHRIEIVLADDHAMIRGGLRRVLDTESDLSVVAEASDAETALREARRHQPPVVVLDLNMPGLPTLAAIPRFLEAAPGSCVVVLTMEDDPRIARQALSAGARGYVLKESAEAELIDAVHSVVAGRTYLAPSLGARMAATQPTPIDRLPGLAGATLDWPWARPSRATGSTRWWAVGPWEWCSERPIARWSDPWPSR